MKYEVKTKKLPDSEMEIEFSLPAELLAEARKKALQTLGASIELPGFRKGHVPENIVIEKVGENGLLEEAADLLLKEHFPLVVVQEKFDIIGRPKISILKLALGNPVELKASFAVMPEVALPDYKAIAKKAAGETKLDTEEAGEKEIADVLLQIRKNKAHHDYHIQNPDDKGHDHPDFDKEESLPPIDDELAKAAGNFKNLEDLKEKIKENIVAEKKHRNLEKKRASIMEALIKETKIDLPNILVESEIEKSLAQMKDDIQRMNGVWADYLAHIKKTEEDLKKELRDSSAKKAKVQLIFNAIAIAEKIEPNKEILETEVKHILEQYKDANEQSARIYVSTILLNQEVLKILEQQ